jgi:hypothetical protein
MTETFNLDAPPGFRGLHPDLPIRIYHRRLPHWRQDGATYAVTFRLADSLPQEQLQSLKRWRELWERSHPAPRCDADWDVMKPLEGFQLEDNLEGLKGFVSRKVNKHLSRTGALWEQESYDRIIRDEEHLYRVIQYIGRNPAKAGYSPDQWVRWIHPDWELAGWGFRDE